MIFCFADCELDVARRLLVRDGEPVHVEPKVFDLLLILVRARGVLVTKPALHARLWRGVRVTDASLRRLVKEARRAVGDRRPESRVIATLHGRGLRLAVPVREVDA